MVLGGCREAIAPIACRPLIETCGRTDDEAAAYAAFCQHYGMEPTRNNAGVSHENGSVEAAHGHLARAQGGAGAGGLGDFPDLASYQAFLAEFVMRKNACRRTAVETELKMMQAVAALSHHRLRSRRSR